MTTHELKHFQKRCARQRANRKRHHIQTRNTTRVKTGPHWMTAAHRAAPGPRNIMEELIHHAVRRATRQTNDAPPPTLPRRTPCEPSAC